MDEMIMAKARYEELMDRMKADMDLAAKYKADLEARYKENMPLEAMITVQSQVLRTQDYITQKFNNLVEIMRGYDELCKAIEEAEKQ